MGEVAGIQVGVGGGTLGCQLHHLVVFAAVVAEHHDLGVGAVLGTHLVDEGVQLFHPYIHGSQRVLGINAVVGTQLYHHDIGLAGKAVLPLAAAIAGGIAVDIVHGYIVDGAFLGALAFKQADAAAGNDGTVGIQLVCHEPGETVGGGVVGGYPGHACFILAQSAVAAGVGVADELNIQALVGGGCFDGAVKGQSGQIVIGGGGTGDLGLLYHTDGVLAGGNGGRESAGAAGCKPAPNLCAIHQHGPVGTVTALVAHSQGAAAAGYVHFKAVAGPIGGNAGAGGVLLGAAQGLDLAAFQKVGQLMRCGSCGDHSGNAAGNQTQGEDGCQDQTQDPYKFFAHNNNSF